MVVLCGGFPKVENLYRLWIIEKKMEGKGMMLISDI